MDGKNIKVLPTQGFEYVESIVNGYSNISILGLSSNNFIISRKREYQVNTFAYTCFLVNNSTPFMWNKDVEDDLDYNLQSLTNGWCTIRVNKFNFIWSNTGQHEGGYTDIYAEGRRLVRMKNTLDKWDIIEGIVQKGKNSHRLKTERIWNKFRKSPKLIESNDKQKKYTLFFDI
jgi:hypothetical protein